MIALVKKLKRSELIIKLLQLIFLLISKLPVRKKTIVFESFLGKQYSDNPKAIYLYIKENYPEYTLYWSIDRKVLKSFENEEQFSLLPRFGIKWFIYMPRAEYWITNSRLPLWLPKPKGTTYVQTWHGTPLKKLALDMEEVHMPGTNTEVYKRNFEKEAEKWDFLVSPNSYSTEIFRRAFNYNKKIIESGYPRNDILINKNNTEAINKIKDTINLPKDKKIILYAPTWRDNQYYDTGKYKFELQMDLQKMQKELGKDYIIILRLHYLVADNLNLDGYEGFIYDFSSYKDISNLYLFADLLITDYSSVFFDYANLKRPIIFYVYDIEEYKDKLRGFYFDIEKDAPGPLVRTTEELISAIKEVDINFEKNEKINEFEKRFCYLEDGFASERVVKCIFNS